MGLKVCCHERLYGQYYLIGDANSWSCDMDFELQDRHGPARRLLE